MLRLNMAVPVTQRNDPNFSSLGIVQAAVLGLTNSTYNSSIALQFIPNMDGFPNGRRLEDDVTRIELQAVSGVALAAIGLWYDDFNGGSPVTPDLVNVLTYNTGINSNDAPFKNSFPYVASPWSGTHVCSCTNNQSSAPNMNLGSNEVASAKINSTGLGLSAPEMNMKIYPNPSNTKSSIDYSVNVPSRIKIVAYDVNGKIVNVLVDQKMDRGVYGTDFDMSNLAHGVYMIVAYKDGVAKQSLKVVKN